MLPVEDFQVFFKSQLDSLPPKLLTLDHLQVLYQLASICSYIFYYNAYNTSLYIDPQIITSIIGEFETPIQLHSNSNVYLHIDELLLQCLLGDRDSHSPLEWLQLLEQEINFLQSYKEEK